MPKFKLNVKKYFLYFFLVLFVAIGFSLFGYLQNKEASAANPVCSGGYCIETFTTVGTTSWTPPAGVTQVEVLVVAGGGGGGGNMGGGGGAGGLLYSASTAVSSQAYSVVVGAGGAGGVGQQKGVNGGNSQFGALTALGGGGGGHYWQVAGLSGGSGGGGGPYPGTYGSGTSGQGNRGGAACGSNYKAGGGGGAGGAGADSNCTTNGTGGSGLVNSISGSAVYYAGGGGGAGYYDVGAVGGIGGGGNGGSTGGTACTSGAANTGGGGGGGQYEANLGCAGGSGIVIIKYVEIINYYTITPGQTKAIVIHGDSVSITNNQSRSIFVPVKNLIEWTKFKVSTFVTNTLGGVLPCTLPWGGTINSGYGVTAYLSDTASCGSLCIPVSRICTNGVLGGADAQYQSCTVNSCSCSLPWGGTLENGTGIKAYSTATVSCGSLCSGETRTCTNTVLSGTYTNQTCTVNACALESCKAILDANQSTGNGLYTIDPDGAGGNAEFQVYCDMTTDGGGWTKLNASIAPVGSVSKGSAVWNSDQLTVGILETSCGVNAKQYTLSEPPVDYNEAYLLLQRVNTLGQCSSISGTSNTTGWFNGPTFNGSYTAATTCAWGDSVWANACCSASNMTGLKLYWAIFSSGANQYPLFYNTECGSGSGTAYHQWFVRYSEPAACDLPWGGTLASGLSVAAYPSSSVACGSTCTPETRTCTDGTLSGSNTAQTCTVGSCSFTSCKDILTGGMSTGDGLYDIDPDGTGGNAAFQVYCDMTNGGWTRILSLVDLGAKTNNMLDKGITFNSMRAVKSIQRSVYREANFSTTQTANFGWEAAAMESATHGRLTGPGGYGVYTNTNATCNWPTTAITMGAGWDGATCGAESDIKSGYSSSGAALTERYNVDIFVNMMTGRCDLPWGGSINDGTSVTAYSASSVACGSSCAAPQTRTCTSGVLSGSYANASCYSACNTSCKTILDANPSIASGSYSIDPDGAGGNAPFSVYCDMTTDGGGWTLLLDGSLSGDYQFGKSSTFWNGTGSSNRTFTYGGATLNTSDSEKIIATMPVSQMRLSGSIFQSANTTSTFAQKKAASTSWSKVSGDIVSLSWNINDTDGYSRGEFLLGGKNSVAASYGDYQWFYLGADVHGMGNYYGHHFNYADYSDSCSNAEGCTLATYVRPSSVGFQGHRSSWTSGYSIWFK